MLIFVAAKSGELINFKLAVKHYLAVVSIKDDNDLNLDKEQTNWLGKEIEAAEKNVNDCLIQTYQIILNPYIDKNQDLQKIIWEHLKVKSIENIVSEVKYQGFINDNLSTLELNNKLNDPAASLWKDGDSVSINDLWNYFTSYLWLPRLTSCYVLENTIRGSIKSEEYFALARSKEGEKYIDLRFKTDAGFFTKDFLLVKGEVAKAQLEEEKIKNSKDEVNTDNGNNDNIKGEKPQVTITSDPPKRQKKHFYLKKSLEVTRINRDVKDLFDEVISNLTTITGSKVKIRLEVRMDSPNGIPQNIVRTVSENCNALKVDDFDFSD